MVLKLGRSSWSKRLAEIEDDVLLGLDVLKRGDKGPCIIHLDKVR